MSLGGGKSCNEVHGDVGPGPIGYGQGMKQAMGAGVGALVLGTDRTSSNKGLEISIHPETRDETRGRRKGGACRLQDAGRGPHPLPNLKHVL